MAEKKSRNLIADLKIIQSVHSWSLKIIELS